MPDFKLDTRLKGDSHPVVTLGLCRLRLMDDARWPWLLLVPQRAGLVEIFDLSPLDQTLLTFETDLVAKALKHLTGCTKINVGSLGNQVRQLHVHVIARREGDAAWPGPVWGHGEREPYEKSSADALIASLRAAL